jgi:hypothetical protein
MILSNSLGQRVRDHCKSTRNPVKAKRAEKAPEKVARWFLFIFIR